MFHFVTIGNPPYKVTNGRVFQMNAGVKITVLLVAFAIVFTGVGFLVSDEYTVGNVMAYTAIGIGVGVLFVLLRLAVDKNRGKKFLEK
ncbi:hypothetical protein [Shouchella miscanthi]|uniref:hypothetical protein n=1 Tax=Shouchella miscanthi TaxID=2598861 RepID=UPI0011A2E5BA|nr:hypothetical protein [Shouchella miscanthi]